MKNCAMQSYLDFVPVLYMTHHIDISIEQL